MESGIIEQSLRELASVGAISKVCLRGRAGGFIIVVSIGDASRTLLTTRGIERLFSLDGASKYLSGMRIQRFEVDVAEFVPGLIRKARPDRAEALKKTKSKPIQGLLV